MTRSTVWLVTRIALWGAALAAVLRMSGISLPADHGICGPWGCGPPVGALIACHGFWVILLLPPMVLLSHHVSAQTRHRLGLLLTLAGIAALSVIGVWEWHHWYAVASAWQRKYLLQRYLFSVATLVDVPVIQVTMVGLFWISAGFRDHRPREHAGPNLPTARSTKSGQNPADLITARCPIAVDSKRPQTLSRIDSGDEISR